MTTSKIRNNRNYTDITAMFEFEEDISGMKSYLKEVGVQLTENEKVRVAYYIIQFDRLTAELNMLIREYLSTEYNLSEPSNILEKLKEKRYKLRIQEDDDIYSLVYFNLDSEAVYFDRVSKKSKRTKRLTSLQLVQILAQMILSNDFHDCAIMLYDDEKKIETLHCYKDDFETSTNLLERN